MRARVVLPVLLWALSLPAAASAEPDLARAERLLGELASHPRAPLVAREVQKAREALERARGARGSGDGKHAEQLEGLARVWAEAASDVLAAAQAEEQAQEAQQKLAESRAQADRERALIEENIARRGRALVELKKAQAEAAERQAQPPPKEKPKGGKKGGGKKGGKK